jgi:phosphatidylserine/phosphatidylglycerophosphate/cardiolipin synthase-like enzyme
VATLVETAAEDIAICTQQLASDEVVTAVANASGRGLGVRILLERDYVTSTAVQTLKNRRAASALKAAGAQVKLDSSSDLLHANFVVTETAAMITSANLSFHELLRDENAAVKLTDRSSVSRLRTRFNSLWNDADAARAPKEGAGTWHARQRVQVLVSPRDNVDDAVAELIDAAQGGIKFAVFVCSQQAAATAALRRALKRGIVVHGAVDGDQIDQPWDAVPTLQREGAHVGYVGGLLSGGTARMHHKLMVIDDTWLSLGTGNFTVSAANNVEVCAIVRGSEKSRIIRQGLAILDRVQGRAKRTIVA